MILMLKFYSMASARNRQGFYAGAEVKAIAFTSKRHQEYTIYGEGNVTIFLFNMHCCFITYILMYMLNILYTLCILKAVLA